MSIRKIDNPDLFRSNIKQKLNDILKDEKNSNNMEKGIFNYSLKESDRHKIVKKWDNTHFIQILFKKIGQNMKIGKFNAVYSRAKELYGSIDDSVSVRAFM